MEKLRFKKNIWLISVSIIAILTLFVIVGTFFDYLISLTIVNPNAFFGKLFANYGQLPAYICLMVAGLLWFKEKGIVKYLGLVSMVVSLGFNVHDGLMYSESWNKYLVLITGILLNSGLSYLIYQKINQSQLSNLQVGIFLICCVVFQVVVINLFKTIMVRPRMILLLKDNQFSFNPWYQCNFALKDQWLMMVKDADYLKSFPSGHSGAASMSVAIALLLANTNNKLKYCIFAFLYTCIVMFSRIVIGAHFLTDVTFGCLIGLICITISYKLFLKGK